MACSRYNSYAPSLPSAITSLYMTGSDVVEHNELDLDMQAMEEGTDALTDDGLTAAFTSYSEGGER